jgi:hypothetical protein
MGKINAVWILWPITVITLNLFIWFIGLEEESLKELWKDSYLNISWPFLWPFYFIIAILRYR